MLTEVRMPKLGMSMRKGTVKRWLVPEGGAVNQGEPLLEVMTEKINAVVESPASGMVGRIVAGPNTELPVGALLALIGEPSDAFPDGGAGAPADAAGPPTAAAQAGRPASATAAPAEAAAVAGPAATEPTASPAARRLARELGVDLTQVRPAAPGKRITSDDVEAFVAARAAQPAESTTEAAAPLEPAPAGRRTPFTGIRRVVAERLHESLQAMAQVTVSREADVTGLVELRQRLAPGFEAASSLHLTYTDLLVEITARLLLDHTALNATLDGDAIVAAEAVHIGVAVALDDGLIVPVIRDAHQRSLGEIAAARAALTAKAQSGTLELDDVEGGTFTISNLGSYGADVFTPIVNPPQCAILGIGRIVQKPVVVDGEVRAVPTMWLSLTFDHRLVDGAPAARFLQALAERLA